MAKRIRLEDKKSNPNLYFATEKTNLTFVSSGCAIFDCALGGGFPLGKVVNVVGDKSTGKTALACEIITNFIFEHPTGKAAYRDVEAAFDTPYAQAMGLPIDDIDFGESVDPLMTVEEFYNDFNTFIDQRMKAKEPGVYVLDSLDALSDDEEMKREIEKGTFAMNKQKQLGVIFRKLIRKIEQSQVLLVIVSQVRDNIGAMFGEKHRRSGGKALDFYASQVVWLAHMGQITKTINKVKRPIGIELKANVKKNKVGLPFRTCEFEFIFGFGVSDVAASINWLNEVGRLGDIDLTAAKVKDYLKELDNLSDKEYAKERSDITKVVKKVWGEIEVSFLPTRQKYKR